MATSTRRAALYVRVSTSDRGQSVENQFALAGECWTAWVEHRGRVFRDEGISGTRGRDKRPGLDALLKGIARREFDIVPTGSACHPANEWGSVMRAHSGAHNPSGASGYAARPMDRPGGCSCIDGMLVLMPSAATAAYQCKPCRSIMSPSLRDEPFRNAVAIARAVFTES
jgi:Resolvase, N terminal domain